MNLRINPRGQFLPVRLSPVTNRAERLVVEIAGLRAKLELALAAGTRRGDFQARIYSAEIARLEEATN